MEVAEEEGRARENYRTQDGTAEPASCTLAHVLECDEQADRLNRWLFSFKDREPWEAANPILAQGGWGGKDTSTFVIVENLMGRRSQTLLFWRDFTSVLKLKKKC